MAKLTYTLCTAVPVAQTGLEQAIQEAGGKRLDPQRRVWAIERGTDILWVWPGAIAGLHLGHLTPVELLHLAAKRLQLRVRYECQAHFHLGVYALWQGNRETARLFFELAAGARPQARLDIEHYLARVFRDARPALAGDWPVFAGPKDSWAAATGKLYATHDGGQSWERGLAEATLAQLGP